MNCDNCKHTRTCTRVWRNSKKECPHFVQKTNADRIRSMTDEELAKLLLDGVYEKVCPNGCDGCDSDCEGHFLNWLKQPYKEE